MSLPPAIILAAGESSRFWPLSTHGHKSLHRLAGKAVIEHTVESLAKAGVDRIIVVQSPIARAAHFPHRTVQDQLGDGSRYDLKIEYVDMDEPSGQRDAIMLCRDRLDEKFFVINPENVNAGEIIPQLMKSAAAAATLAVKEQEETWLFGVLALDGERVQDIVEKPEPGSEPSRLCNMGMHLLGQEYLDLLAAESAGDHVANLRALVKLASSHEVRYCQVEQPFFPLKYPWHLFAIAKHLAPEGFIDPEATIDPSASVQAGCVIEKDASIGPEVTLAECLVGAGSDVQTSLTDSILGAAVQLHKGATIENTALDGGHVFVDVKGHSVSTSLKRLGAAIGQGSTICPGAKVTAGTLIGAESTVKGGRPVTTNVPDRIVVGN